MSYRATQNEKDVTRGRANVLRLALSGQLGPGAIASTKWPESLKLCVSCKACRRECPTGVDMARMKIEVLAARARTGALNLRDRLVGYMPRYARFAARLRGLNLRNRSALLARFGERSMGIAASRQLPPGGRTDSSLPACWTDGGPVVLFADTFNSAFQREKLDAALKVLTAAGYRVLLPRAADGASRPVCGRARSSRQTSSMRPKRRCGARSTFAPYAGARCAGRRS